MDVGKLNEKIAVYRQAYAEDEVLATDEPSDELVCKIWANIATRTGSMLTGRDAGTILSQTTHAITVRSRGDITSDCYILWMDLFGIEHKFDIDYVRPPGKDRLMLIYATEQI